MPLGTKTMRTKFAAVLHTHVTKPSTRVLKAL